MKREQTTNRRKKAQHEETRGGASFCGTLSHMAECRGAALKAVSDRRTVSNVPGRFDRRNSYSG